MYVGYAPAGSVSPHYINSWPVVQLQNSTVVFVSASGSDGTFRYNDRLSACSAWIFHSSHCKVLSDKTHTKLKNLHNWGLSSRPLQRFVRRCILHIITSHTTRFMVASLALPLIIPLNTLIYLPCNSARYRSKIVALLNQSLHHESYETPLGGGVVRIPVFRTAVFWPIDLSVLKFHFCDT